MVIIIITDIDYNGADKDKRRKYMEGEKAMSENKNDRKREKMRMHACE